ncbi:hypothetical protein U9M48_026562 [Paspalum notatum var. saurae]|uniref:Uncharacterized protein n=1 Tax=Paspalum notatum var. saurae TaxID=547442 RepID=A0AAQ3WZ47_PASNO
MPRPRSMGATPHGHRALPCVGYRWRQNLVASSSPEAHAFPRVDPPWELGRLHLLSAHAPSALGLLPPCLSLAGPPSPSSASVVESSPSCLAQAPSPTAADPSCGEPPPPPLLVGSSVFASCTSPSPN